MITFFFLFSRDSLGVAFPAIHSMIASQVPPQSQSLAVGIVTAASYAGAIVGKKRIYIAYRSIHPPTPHKRQDKMYGHCANIDPPLSFCAAFGFTPLIIRTLGWPAVFFSFGLLPFLCFFPFWFTSDFSKKAGGGSFKASATSTDELTWEEGLKIIKRKEVTKF